MLKINSLSILYLARLHSSNRDGQLNGNFVPCTDKSHISQKRKPKRTVYHHNTRDGPKQSECLKVIAVLNQIFLTLSVRNTQLIHTYFHTGPRKYNVF